jgi:hypothetical protein
MEAVDFATLPRPLGPARSVRRPGRGVCPTIDRFPDTNQDGEVAPVRFGQDVAAGDLGEPLGTVARKLKPDAAGIHWWGSLGESLPVNSAERENWRPDSAAEASGPREASARTVLSLLAWGMLLIYRMSNHGSTPTPTPTPTPIALRHDG